MPPTTPNKPHQEGTIFYNGYNSLSYLNYGATYSSNYSNQSYTHNPYNQSNNFNYYNQFMIPNNSIITFDLQDQLFQKIKNETRNWGTLRWRDQKLGDKFWGHIYLTVDSKIVAIIKEAFGKCGLIEKIRDYITENSELSPNYEVEYNGFLLPSHFSVISSKEWQHEFFELENSVEMFSVSNPLTNAFDSYVEFVNSSYTSYSKETRQGKMQDLYNYCYYETSETAKSLPHEINLLIKDFLILDFKEVGRKFTFELTGQISLVPRYFGNQPGFILHTNSSDLNQIRRKYGFDPIQFAIPLGFVYNNFNSCTTQNSTTPVTIRNYSKQKE